MKPLLITDVPVEHSLNLDVLVAKLKVLDVFVEVRAEDYNIPQALVLQKLGIGIVLVVDGYEGTPNSLKDAILDDDKLNASLEKFHPSCIRYVVKFTYETPALNVICLVLNISDSKVTYLSKYGCENDFNETVSSILQFSENYDKEGAENLPNLEISYSLDAGYTLVHYPTIRGLL